jgi:hypothetical protein
MPYALHPKDTFRLETANRCFREWEQPGCDLAAYGCLDRYRSGDELIRLRSNEL